MTLSVLICWMDKQWKWGRVWPKLDNASQQLMYIIFLFVGMFCGFDLLYKMSIVYSFFPSKAWEKFDSFILWWYCVYACKMGS